MPMMSTPPFSSSLAVKPSPAPPMIIGLPRFKVSLSRSLNSSREFFLAISPSYLLDLRSCRLLRTYWVFPNHLFVNPLGPYLSHCEALTQEAEIVASVSYCLEFFCLLGNGHLCGETLHAGSPVESVDPLSVFENVCRVFRHGNGAPMAEADDVGIDGFSSIYDFLHFTRGFLKGDRRGRTYGAIRCE